MEDELDGSPSSFHIDLERSRREKKKGVIVGSTSLWQAELFNTFSDQLLLRVFLMQRHDSRI
jgi:hypothetical protein